MHTSGSVHCSRDPQISFFNNFFIKNGSYGTIHIFKNYFAIVFSVFNICLDMAFCVSKFGVLRFLFFFVFAGVSAFTRQSALLSTIYALFTEPTTTLFRKIYILKMGQPILFTHLKIILLQSFKYSAK